MKAIGRTWDETYRRGVGLAEAIEHNMQGRCHLLVMGGGSLYTGSVSIFFFEYIWYLPPSQMEPEGHVAFTFLCPVLTRAKAVYLPQPLGTHGALGPAGRAWRCL